MIYHAHDDYEVQNNTDIFYIQQLCKWAWTPSCGDKTVLTTRKDNGSFAYTRASTLAFLFEKPPKNKIKQIENNKINGQQPLCATIIELAVFAKKMTITQD